MFLLAAGYKYLQVSVYFVDLDVQSPILIDNFNALFQ